MTPYTDKDCVDVFNQMARKGFEDGLRRGRVGRWRNVLFYAFWAFLVPMAGVLFILYTQYGDF
jgi:hypothetical protein